MKSYMQISNPIMFLCGFFLVAQFFNGIMAARAGYAAVSNPWYALAFYWAFVWWFIDDSRKHDIKWADDYLDMGMFLYIAGIFLVPYYLFKSRGWKALYIIGLFLGIYFGAYLVGVIFYSLLRIL
jgi:hypothetical protein